MGKIFENLKIIDFTNNVAGPVTAAMFADFGAEVIKIERPKIGDDTRWYPPLIEGDGSGFWWHNRGKKSVEVALGDPEGIEFVKKIIADCDILVQSFRPGAMDRLGLSYEEVKKINPALIYVSISTFGQDGPFAQYPGYDMIAQAISGLIDVTGEPGQAPNKIGVYLGDYVGALVGYSGALTALYHREQTGEGQLVDVSLLEGLMYINENINRAGIGEDPTRRGNLDASMAPYGIYDGKDGQSAVVAAPNDKLWGVLCQLMDKEEYITDERFNSSANRVTHNPEIAEILSEWLSGFDKINDAVNLLLESGIPAAPITSAKELLDHPQVIHREAVVDMVLPKNIKSMRTAKVRNSPIKLSKAKAEIIQSATLGEHNDEIFKRYGIDSAKQTELLEKWYKK